MGRYDEMNAKREALVQGSLGRALDTRPIMPTTRDLLIEKMNYHHLEIDKIKEMLNLLDKNPDHERLMDLGRQLM